MIEKYGLNPKDMQFLTLFDGIVISILENGYCTPFEIAVVLPEIVKREYRNLFPDLDRVNLDEWVKNSLKKFTDKGFVEENDGIFTLTDKGNKLVEFIKNDTDIYDKALENLPRKRREREKIAKEKERKEREEFLKPKVVINDEVKLVKGTEDGGVVTLFQAPVYMLEEFLTENPEKFAEFMTYILNKAGKTIGVSIADILFPED